MHDPLVRRDVPGSVHKMRVAVRRLQHALASFRPLLDRGVSEALRGELRWLAGALGEPRDAEVMHERLRSMLDQEEAEMVRGAARTRVEDGLNTEYRQARERLLDAMSSARYLDLLDGLHDLADHGPWSDAAAKPAGEVMPRRVRHAFKRLQRDVVAAVETPDPAEREERLHDARKAAKRARYAAECLSDLYGKPAKRYVKAITRLQETLGDHHDAVVSQRRLSQLAEDAAHDGEDSFTFGVLHTREQAAAEEMEARFTRAWSKASRKSLRAWTKASSPS
jgi:CHAD domain-containing protein